MGTIRVEVTVSNLSDRSRSRSLFVFVDTGATYTRLPAEVIDALGCEPIGTRQVLLANGREEEWPVSAVLLRVDGREGPTFCLIGPPGSPALLGAVTLEEFALGVDPVAQRLVPVRSYLLGASAGVARNRRLEEIGRVSVWHGSSAPTGAGR